MKGGGDSDEDDRGGTTQLLRSVARERLAALAGERGPRYSQNSQQKGLPSIPAVIFHKPKSSTSLDDDLAPNRIKIASSASALVPFTPIYTLGSVNTVVTYATSLAPSDMPLYTRMETSSITGSLLEVEYGNGSRYPSQQQDRGGAAILYCEPQLLPVHSRSVLRDVISRIVIQPFA